MKENSCCKTFFNKYTHQRKINFQTPRFWISVESLEIFACVYIEKPEWLVRVKFLSAETRRWRSRRPRKRPLTVFQLCAGFFLSGSCERWQCATDTNSGRNRCRNNEKNTEKRGWACARQNGSVKQSLRFKTLFCLLTLTAEFLLQWEPHIWMIQNALHRQKRI